MNKLKIYISSLVFVVCSAFAGNAVDMPSINADGLTRKEYKKKDFIPTKYIMITGSGNFSPNKKDEPQHIVKGKITRELLRLLKIKYCILRKTSDLKRLSKIK